MKAKILILFVLSFIFGEFSLFAQDDINSEVQVGVMGEKISNFKLTSYQGNEVSLSDYAGKNIILIFPRGKVLDYLWCAICHYQYAELADLDKINEYRKKYNVEVLYVLPYVKDSIAKWANGFQKSFGSIERWKNPKNPESLKEGQKAWMETCRKHFPGKYDYPEIIVKMPFPVLMDADQKVSKGFDLLRTEWDGTKTSQNVPTIFIIDKTGTIRFKYHSQSTLDRPNAKYLIDFIEKML